MTSHTCPNFSESNLEFDIPVSYIHLKNVLNEKLILPKDITGSTIYNFINVLSCCIKAKLSL